MQHETAIKPATWDTATDFNDLHQLAGLDAVKRVIDHAINSQQTADQCIERMGLVCGEDGKVYNRTDEDLLKPVIVAPQNLTKPDIQSETLNKEQRDALIDTHLKITDSFERVCNETVLAGQLGITKAELKAILSAELKKQANLSKNQSENGTSILFADVEPWHEPVNGAILLNDILAQLEQYVIADQETLHAAALWVCMTWLTDYATVLPLAMITAPEKGCGKSTLLTAMAKMAYKPLQAANTTAAATFRAIEAIKPTLFIDEADTFLRDNEDMRCIINSGHTRDSAYVLRTVGEDFETKVFSTWCAKAVCGIGHLPETIESRSIMLKMRRKMPHEKAGNLRHANAAVFNILQQKLARWSMDNAEAFSKLQPVMTGLSNRDADNYEPLLAIAILAGGEWESRIKIAARILTQSEHDNRSIGVELLEACQLAFDRLGVDKVKSVELLDEICKDEEAPFATYNRGKPMTPRQLSNRLKQYGISPKTARFTRHSLAKGYELSQFENAFQIYLGGTDILAVTPLQVSVDKALSVTQDQSVTVTTVTEHLPKPLNVTLVTVTQNPTETAKASIDAGCNRVTDQTSLCSEESVFEANGHDEWLNAYDNAASQRSHNGGQSWEL